MPAVIRSLLDTDLYKFTMMQIVLHRFAAAEVEYRFFCRTPEVDFRPCFEPIKQEVQALEECHLSTEELRYLAGFDYFQADFLAFLRLFRFDPDYVHLDLDGNQLELRIRGPWLHCILFEVPLLALINETYFQHRHPDPDWEEGRKRLREKIHAIQHHPAAADFSFTDFGTRRRFSRRWQQELLETLQQQLPAQLQGTSNVDLAQRLGLTPVGTMAHEFLQACQALGPRLQDSQRFALESWAQEYRGQLGIALTDVVGMDAFLRDFDLYFARLYQGLRHDSGDPVPWAEKAIAHYRQLGIDPRSRTLVFSDGLTVERALTLCERLRHDAYPTFGIGTHLTNDLGYPRLDIVIKMTRCNGQPVAKLSDSPGKLVCEDPVYLRYLAQVFQQDLSAFGPADSS
ncbi:nicotinate phosphoribosyltransferase [Motiliproteus sp. SC1-56]|uniref:nicotinate phosphoribosyltransferase n=1 Tax=Motiliproteus sp. SC1-56 TaxID=2799565 RepID=UPI001A8DA402|nr:nicotinate phosphoribosyltransferase [Motiliproteus sp. SC1-56]